MGEPDYDHKVIKYDLDKAKWEQSNRKCLMVIKYSIVESIKGAITECDTAKEYLERVAAQFVGSSKAYASTLTKQFVNMKYDGSGIRTHIHKMSSMAAKLNKYFKAPLPDEFVVHIIMQSLPKEYETFHVNYNNSVKDQWSLDQLLAQCVQEEERLKSHNGDTVNLAQDKGKAKKRNYYNKQYKKPAQDGPSESSGQGASSSKPPPKFPNKPRVFSVPMNTCLHCKQEGHHKKRCPDFLKYLLDNGKDQVTFIDESMYLEFSTSTWRIDSGATVYIANSLQGFRSKRMLPSGRRSIRVATGKEASVKAIGDLHLELTNGFVLILRDVLFVPSLRRNLISVSRLDDENIHSHFGDHKCVIQCNDKDVGLAVRRDMLYLLSPCNVVNLVEASDSVLVTSNSNKRKRNDGETSSKLWHCRLGHISRGRIELLVKAEILHPLDFTDLEHCIECIKGKFAKKIKKTAKRSSGVLEIIHTDICGPFPIRTVDGFDSFITFTDDYSHYGYIYPIKERSEALDKFKIFKSEV